eukprot:GHVT01063494.1.p1 GENE.GHVT01063494.1~~GHVT01063494.1.p1  ORF type:complete len:461 (+),score=16.93 GHVT01063494.1:885-2267(+)
MPSLSICSKPRTMARGFTENSPGVSETIQHLCSMPLGEGYWSAVPRIYIPQGVDFPIGPEGSLSGVNLSECRPGGGCADQEFRKSRSADQSGASVEQNESYLNITVLVHRMILAAQGAYSLELLHKPVNDFEELDRNRRREFRITRETCWPKLCTCRSMCNHGMTELESIPRENRDCKTDSVHVPVIPSSGQHSQMERLSDLNGSAQNSAVAATADAHNYKSPCENSKLASTIAFPHATNHEQLGEKHVYDPTSSDSGSLARARCFMERALVETFVPKPKRNRWARRSATFTLFGHDEHAQAGHKDISVRAITSKKACGLVATCFRRHLIVVSFRGTKEVADVTTDFSFLPTEFVPRDAAVEASDSEPSVPNPKVHRGFMKAFNTIKDDIERLVTEKIQEDIKKNLPDAQQGEASTRTQNRCNVIFVGHSMGGALALLAAAYFRDLRPHLITFGAPAVGG